MNCVLISPSQIHKIISRLVTVSIHLLAIIRQLMNPLTTLNDVVSFLKPRTSEVLASMNDEELLNFSAKENLMKAYPDYFSSNFPGQWLSLKSCMKTKITNLDSV
jgi:hypothetical protein